MAQKRETFKTNFEWTTCMNGEMVCPWHELLYPSRYRSYFQQMLSKQEIICTCTSSPKCAILGHSVQRQKHRPGQNLAVPWEGSVSWGFLSALVCYNSPCANQMVSVSKFRKLGSIVQVVFQNHYSLTVCVGHDLCLREVNSPEMDKTCLNTHQLTSRQIKITNID